jgi:hypothetical protein
VEPDPSVLQTLPSPPAALPVEPPQARPDEAAKRQRLKDLGTYDELAEKLAKLSVWVPLRMDFERVSETLTWKAVAPFGLFSSHSPLVQNTKCVFLRNHFSFWNIR